MRWPRTLRILGRVADWTARIVVGVVVGALALFTAALFALRFEPVQRAVLTRTNTALADMFQGRIVVDRVGRVGLGGATGVDARVLDAAGAAVVDARGADVELFWPELLWQALIERPAVLPVAIDSVEIDHVELTLRDDGHGTPTLATAFEPRSPRPPSPEGGGARVSIPRLTVHHAWVHGELGGAPRVDADVHRLAARLESDPERLALDLRIARLTARALPASLDPDGRVTATLRLPTRSKRGMRVNADFSGHLARAPSTLHVELDDDRLNGKLDVTGIGRDSLAALSPALQPAAPITLRASIDGSLSDLRVKGDADVAGGALELEGRVVTPDEKRGPSIDARLRARDLDASKLFQAAPSTQLSFEADARADVTSETGIRGGYALRTRSMQLESVALPLIRAQGALTVDENGVASGTGDLEVDEPGARMRARYELSRVGRPEGVVTLSARAQLENPPRLAPVVSLGGSAELRAVVRPSARTLSADLSSKLRAFRAPGVHVERADVTARVEGPFAAPRLDVAITGSGAQLGARELRRVSASARGTTRAFDVNAELVGNAPEHVELRSHVEVGEAIRLIAPRAVARTGPEQLTLTARTVTFSERATRVEDAELVGVGSARASLEWTDRPTWLEVSTDGLEPTRALRVLGIHPPFETKVFDVEAHYVDQGPGGPIGSLSGNIEGVQLDGTHDASLRFDLAVARRTLSGAVEMAARGARVRLTADEVRIPDAPWSMRTLGNAQGSLVASGRVNLARVRPILVWFLPIGSARGEVAFDVRLTRARQGARGVVLAARLETQAIELTGLRHTEQTVRTAELARRSKPWSIAGVDAGVALELDANAGRARLDALLRDARGSLLEAHATAEPRPARDFAQFLTQDPKRIPIHARLSAPPRALQELPELIRPNTLRGVSSAEVELEGTLASPRLRADATVSCLGAESSAETMDVVLAAEYTARAGRFDATATAKNKSIAEVRARWDGDLRRLGEARNANTPSPVRADVALHLSRFPLQLIPALAHRQIRGPISGSFTLDAYGRAAHAAARFTSDRIVIGDVGVRKFEVGLDARDGLLFGTLEVGGNRGLAHAELRVPMTWGDRTLPLIEPNGEAKLVADNFRLETLSPLLAAHLSELEGRLDANVDARLLDGRPELRGTATLSRGVVHVPTIGQRFRDIRAKLTIASDRIVLEELEARGLSGRVTANGTATLGGLGRLRFAEAHVRIGKGDKIPITLEGSPMGDAWGNIDITVDTLAEEHITRVRIDVPELHVETPESNPAALQNLEPAADIRVGTWVSRDFVTVPVQVTDDGDTREKPSRTRVEINLGRSVWFRRGQMAQVQLRGQLVIVQNHVSSVTGQIVLPTGTLDVQGKRFEVERGVVTFTGGDPTNPTIVAVARWDSPEGYVVYAEYSGTVREGQLALRSEPPLSDNEILSLLMFGTPEGTFGSRRGSSTAAAAVGIAGGTATQGLNRVLANVTELDVTARIDTSTGTARPELVVQLSPRVTARVTRAVGEPPTGQSPDRTFLRVDFRLRRAWSLSTMIGDRGASAVDLIWRKRY